MNQRDIIEKRVRPWTKLRSEQTPPSGWIKAMRGALGLTTRQLAELLGVSQAAVTMLEKREASGKATIEFIQKTAKAMNCKLVYAIVPDHPHSSLDSIVSTRALAVAEELIKKVDHTMSLEKQGSETPDSKKEIERLAEDLKSRLDPRLWSKSAPKGSS